MHIHILVKISKQVSEVKSSWRRLVWESSCGAFCCSGQCDASAAGLWRCSIGGQCCSLKCSQSVKRCSAQCTLESVHWQSAFFFKNSSLPKCTVCTVPSSLPKCAVHSAHLHSTQRTVRCAKYKVHSVQQLNCDASTAAQLPLTCWAALHPLSAVSSSPYFPL